MIHIIIEYTCRNKHNITPNLPLPTLPTDTSTYEVRHSLTQTCEQRLRQVDLCGFNIGCMKELLRWPLAGTAP